MDQGNWQCLKIKARSIAKFTPGNPAKVNAAVSVTFEKLSAQVQAKDKAKMDLSRQSRDSALYGNLLFLKFEVRN